MESKDSREVSPTIDQRQSLMKRVRNKCPTYLRSHVSLRREHMPLGGNFNGVGLLCILNERYPCGMPTS